ncbi:MAG: hypothetical protein HRU00_00170 [Myxococcales bacterium]|nr:hypothetical protein [Myxococcales bacterium]
MKRCTGILLAALVLACVGASSAPVSRQPGDSAAGPSGISRDPIDERAAELESAVRSDPSYPQLRDDLGRVYYLRARRALDEGRFADYQADLGRALDEWIESARLNPESPSPHTWMGIVAVYQGDLKRALRSFQNARRLEPRSWVAYTNLAQTLIYDDQLSAARRYLMKGQRRGAPPVVIELNEVLAAWRQGDMVEARDVFRSAYALNPEEVNTWDEAPVDDPIESFHDFMAYCCENPACGPYLEDECREMQLSVARRQVADETLLQELRLEMDRRRRLREIYRNRKDLKVEIAEPEATP